MREFIEKVLAPRISGDGGWVEFVSYKEGELTLIFRGECSKCMILDRCLDWIRQQAREKLGEEIRIIPVRKKPFFWDNTN